MTRIRHLFSSDEVMNESDAISMAEKRDPRIQKTTIFEESSSFLHCKIILNARVEAAIVSENPVRTFHCIYQESVWIPIYLGKYYAVFTDGGHNFPGYLVQTVNFYNWKIVEKFSWASERDSQGEKPADDNPKQSMEPGLSKNFYELMSNEESGQHLESSKKADEMDYLDELFGTDLHKEMRDLELVEKINFSNSIKNDFTD